MASFFAVLSHPTPTSAISVANWPARYCGIPLVHCVHFATSFQPRSVPFQLLSVRTADLLFSFSFFSSLRPCRGGYPLLLDRGCSVDLLGIGPRSTSFFAFSQEPHYRRRRVFSCFLFVFFFFRPHDRLLRLHYTGLSLSQ